MAELPARYDPIEEEAKIQQWWEDAKIYEFDPADEAEIYSIDTPPPTFSGNMHIGHAFSYAQTDFIARYHRMQGKNVFYPFGVDDNGLATERLVEKEKKVSSKKMEREEFVQLCLQFVEEHRNDFVTDWKKLGISADFNVFYSTISDHARAISQRSFVHLYKDGRIKRKKSPIIFCPTCKTAIAQVEMEDVEKKSTLNYIKAQVETGEYVIYATTRPELHPGCMGLSIDEAGVYVVANRGEEQWILAKDAVEKLQDEFPMTIVRELKGKDLVGRKVEIPYAQTVAITHDTSVKTEYGTGIVYYCSYGGLDCVEWFARHPDAQPVDVMDETGCYTTGPCAGLRSAEARKKIIEQLENDGSLVKKEKIKHFVNVHERCGTDIEYIATDQWFITYMDLQEQFLQNGSELNWHPAHMQVRLDNWIKGLQWDWCISRQRHFGVPIPVWYDKKGEVILPSDDELPVDPLRDVPKGYKKEELTPEHDVLDTWATSSLTPQIATELYKDHPVFKRLFPMSLRPQAHDIITFWLFNTMVKSQLHHKKNPWKDVAISGFTLDPHGRKLSKSKGNAVHPQEVLKNYGADALRFWAAGAKLGEDFPFQEKDFVTGKKTITKLWNASKFVVMNLEDYTGFNAEFTELEVMDRWMLSKYNTLVKECAAAFDNYEYSKVKFAVEQFFWKDFCDNYLEIVKGRLYEPKDNVEKSSAQFVLSHVLEGMLKLFAPFMPYITEKIYGMLPFENKAKSIHLSSWPSYREEWHDNDAEMVGHDIVLVIEEVRKFKSANQLSMRAPVKKLTVTTKHDIRLAENDLVAVTNAEGFDHKHGEFLVVIE
ncbi:MAG: valine--tRNA ligase [Candidatus Woesearchaeota archaeon]|nr:valine--tRNA ligase [Candidatus Woesearchaeota archaeon]